MKRIVSLIAAFILSLTLLAAPAFQQGKSYKITCQQFPAGCVTDGASAGQSTPLYYLQSASSNSVSQWLFNEVEDGIFTIRNAGTGRYVTYDGQRQDSPKLLRYITMTSSDEGAYSHWQFSQQSEGVYAIRNLGQSDHLWDVRVDSYCVGTYSNTGAANQNQSFSFYDDTGLLIKEQSAEPIIADGHNVTSWLIATTESASGWTFEGSEWTSPNHGYYQNGSASVIIPFLERWNDTTQGTLANHIMSQTLRNLPAGQYDLTADIIAVRQPSSGWYSISEEIGQGVYLFANNGQTETGTHNQQPQRFTVPFTVGTDGAVTLGLRIRNTNANWVAIDNISLYFQGTAAELIAGEIKKVKTELTDYFTDEEISDQIAACNNSFDALETLRHSIDLLPAIDPLSSGAKNICIDGRQLTYVQSSDYYLATIDESSFGKEYTATITYEKREGWSDLTIDSHTVSSGSTYTFRQVEAGQYYTFTMKKSDGTTVSKDVIFTALPIVSINGSFSDNYSDGTIQVIEPGKSMGSGILNMKAKWRGGITNTNGKHKRNYHVKLKDADGNKMEKSFFGLRNDNSWILESCQVDMSRIRNRVLTDLWNDYATPPYYIGKEKKAKSGTNGQFVELILNGEYRGIYCMTENMDRKQMKLMKYDETTGTTHGQLWKSKDWSYAVFMGTVPDGNYQPKDYLSTPYASNEMWDSYQVKYPDISDYGTTDWQVLYDAVRFVCYSTDDEFRKRFTEYFDLPVVIDYYILMETILSTDNHGKNMFFAVYDKQTDKRITFGVWDMDATCGQRWSDQYYHSYLLRPDQDYAEFISVNEHGDYNLFRRLRKLDVDDFNMQVRLRYRDLRNSHLRTDNILQRFRTYLDCFKLCGADQREAAKWSYDSDVNGHVIDFDSEMDYIDDWFTRRMTYLDNTRFNISELPATGISNINTEAVAPHHGIYTISGRKISDDSSEEQLHKLQPGMYIINGRKTIVR